MSTDQWIAVASAGAEWALVLAGFFGLLQWRAARKQLAYERDSELARRLVVSAGHLRNRVLSLGGFATELGELAKPADDSQDTDSSRARSAHRASLATRLADHQRELLAGLEEFSRSVLEFLAIRGDDGEDEEEVEAAYANLEMTATKSLQAIALALGVLAVRPLPVDLRKAGEGLDWVASGAAREGLEASLIAVRGALREYLRP